MHGPTALALMQSCACTMSYSPRSNARRMVSIDRMIRSVTVSFSIVANSMSRSRTLESTVRKKPLSAPRARDHTVTSAPVSASASANASVCTTPPRGLVE